MDLKEKLSSLMKQNGIKNLYDLSRQCDIPYTTLRNIMIDNISNIRIDTAIKLCDFFKVSLDELLQSELDLSEIEFASYNGIESADCLTIDELQEVNDFIQYIISKRSKQEQKNKKEK